MKLALLLIALLLFSFPIASCPPNNNDSSKEDVYFGVTFGGKTATEAKLLIDKVKAYSNLFIVNSWDVSVNETELNETCNYAFNANLSFIVYIYISSRIYPWQPNWLETAKQRWGDKFLGIYLYDEPGGKQIDKGQWDYSTAHGGVIINRFENVTNQAEAANRFVTSIANTGNMRRLKNLSISAFTSDYALYWFDYLAGYNVVFAELGWDHKQAQHIALCRGAAKVQNKQWGAIIAWASNEPPYLASSSKMYEDLVLAYHAGAKYLIVFNYPQLNPYGALTDEHFNAIEKFWNYVHNAQEGHNMVDSDVAFVLPKDFGWGMRHPYDKIWGLWAPDENSTSIGQSISDLIEEYNTKLDVIYDEPQFNFANKYSKIYYWNGTVADMSKSSMDTEFIYLLLIATTLSGLIALTLIKYQIKRRNSIQSIPNTTNLFMER
jgi:hypothetical protein